MAYREVKPSNVLLYKNIDNILITKITDFGIAADLEAAVVWQPGTIRAKSTQRYDVPEVRKLSYNIEAPRWLTPQQLQKNDTWKLGAVFLELLTCLVCGRRGITEFWNHITTTYNHLTSDGIEDTRFDDGERVKPEVQEQL